MEDQNIHNVYSIRKYLEGTEAQRRVQESILRAREDVTVTIGRAAELFDFSENQLRDWESKGFLKPRRSKDKGGQRLYALAELDKLALIKELTENGGYNVGSIPLTVDDVWHEVFSDAEGQKAETREKLHKQNAGSYLSIDKRVDEASKADFWQYYISKTLHVVVSLIFEDIPDTIAGIILPLERKENATHEWKSEDLSKLGPCIIGWRDQDRTFHTFYQEIPSFEYPTDFRVRGLQVDKEDREGAKDPTFVVIQREVRNLSLSSEVVKAVRHVLKPIYDDIDILLPFFKDNPRNIVYSTSVSRGINSSDSLLTFLANRIICLGGKNADGKDRWKFCCVLLPKASTLPLQMQTLVVQAQSQHSPHFINITSVSPDVPILSLSLRAFQSIHSLLRTSISKEDTTIVYPDSEAPINSAIAMPIGGENGTPLGVLYVVSEEVEAFGREYQRALRLMVRVIKELLLIVQVRLQSEERLRDIITQPLTVNQTLASFASENKLINDIEALLRSIKETNNPAIEGQTAFISIDIDNLTEMVSRHDDQLSINLSKLMGDRIREQIGFFFDKKKENDDYRIYHAYSDRFYIRLEGISLDLARENAEKLRKALQGEYLVSLVSSTSARPRDRVELKDVTVRLGVLWYEHKKLYDLLLRYSPQTRLADVRATILNFLDASLNMGKQKKGGNCIISFYPKEPPKFMHGRFDLWPLTNEE